MRVENREKENSLCVGFFLSLLLSPHAGFLFHSLVFSCCFSSILFYSFHFFFSSRNKLPVCFLLAGQVEGVKARENWVEGREETILREKLSDLLSCCLTLRRFASWRRSAGIVFHFHFSLTLSLSLSLSHFILPPNFRSHTLNIYLQNSRKKKKKKIQNQTT